MSVLKILFVALLVFLPFGELLRFEIGNNIVLNPLDITAVLLLCSVMFVFFRKKTLLFSLQWYYIAFPAVALASLVINSYWLAPHQMITASLYLVRWVAYLSIIFAILLFDKSFKKKIQKFLIADGIVLLLIGFLQYFFYPSLRNMYYLGWDEHLYRMFSSFLDPNFAGAFFVLYIIFIAGLLFQTSKKRNKREVVLYSILLIVTLLAIFLTYSRSALLMLLVSGILFFIITQKKKFIFYLLGAIALFISIVSPFFYLENIDLLRVNSSIARVATTQNALMIIQDHPLIGVGFNTYRYAQQRYHFTTANTRFSAHSAAGVDTSLLFVLVTTGILGLLSYGYLWYGLLKKAAHVMNHNRYALAFFVSGIGLFFNALFINSLFYPEIMLWMWVIFGLMNEKS